MSEAQSPKQKCVRKMRTGSHLLTLRSGDGWALDGGWWVGVGTACKHAGDHL